MGMYLYLGIHAINPMLIWLTLLVNKAHEKYNFFVISRSKLPYFIDVLTYRDVNIDAKV